MSDKQKPADKAVKVPALDTGGTDITKSKTVTLPNGTVVTNN